MDKIGFYAYAAGGSSSMPYIGEHTYGYTVGSFKKIYFDCGGGHYGSDTKELLTVSGDISDLVRMTLGLKNPPTPYKGEYGKNDVTGQQTCGVIMSGFSNRYGTCQQAVNRLLYAISPDKKNPMTILNSAHFIPRGHLLTLGIFGTWGFQFDNWCLLAGFPPPGSAEEIQIRSLNFLSTEKQEFVLKHLADLKEKGPEILDNHDAIDAFYNTIADKLTLEEQDMLGIRK